MKIYHLHIKDNDAAEYDTHFHFTHATKDGSDLWGDYNSAYAFVIDNLNDWDINDVITKLKESGWTEVEVERVEVEY